MRLVPRFFLRLALIVLTIFLIVFGVGVKYWRDYQEHERLAKVFNRNGIQIEEEPITLAGYFLGKCATGLLVESNYAESSDLEMLGQLPRPRDVRRLSFVGGQNLKHVVHQILETIRLYPKLEALELKNFELSAIQLQELKNFRQLEYLSLDNCKLPAAAQESFSGMNALKTLILSGDAIEMEQLAKNDLPCLEYLELNRDEIGETLDLTKAGLGHFPNLQYLRVLAGSLKQIKCEDNAMPRLRYLDLNSLEIHSTIPWDELARLAPNLEAISINAHHLNEDSIIVLASLKRLTHLEYDYFAISTLNDPHDSLVVFSTPRGDKLIKRSKLQLAMELMKRCPQLQWHSSQRIDRDSWRHEFFLPERNIEGKFMRASQNWRPRQ